MTEVEYTNCNALIFFVITFSYLNEMIYTSKLKQA